MGKRCSGCNGERIAKGYLPGGTHSPPVAQVAVDAKPGLLNTLGVGRVVRKLRAAICADCGLVQLFAEDPEALYEAHLKKSPGESAGT